MCSGLLALEGPRVNSTRKKHIFQILVPVFIILSVNFALAAVYWNTTITSTGNIVAYGCRVYLEDKGTENYNVNWGDIAVNSSSIQYRWIYNHGAGANIEWSHNAPSYLQLKIYYEQPTGTWNLWNPGTSKSLSQGQWLHTKLKLTALSDAINHIGAFQFNIYVELT